MNYSSNVEKIRFKDIELTNKYRINGNYNRLNHTFGKTCKCLVKRIPFLKKIFIKTSNNGKYKFVFFKLSNYQYRNIEKKIVFEIEVMSVFAVATINEYMAKKRYHLNFGLNILEINKDSLEIGENIFAYTGLCEIKNIIFDRKLTKEPSLISEQEFLFQKCNNTLEVATSYLCASIIEEPKTSPFKGSCYTIYDYDNECYRMPCWLWSDAPVVSALLEMAKKTFNEDKRKYYEKTAEKIGNTLINHQIMDPSDKNFGAFVSRYRYYNTGVESFECLLGPNDTSFIVKWALLPLYNYTKKEKFKIRSELALDWVQKIIYEFDFVPSQYYFHLEKWEESAFVDTGFTPEGFCEYCKLSSFDRNKMYCKAVDFFMTRYIQQFKLKSGFYGQNYSPKNGVNDAIFTRGQAWVLEGLLSAYNLTKQDYYKNEAVNIAKLLLNEQNKDGSWAYLLGYSFPNKSVKNKTGICEKVTAILGYLMLELYIINAENSFFESGKLALKWCENNIVYEKKVGYGGIASRSLVSGITGLPYVRVATGYANAYYVLGSLLYEELTTIN